MRKLFAVLLLFSLLLTALPGTVFAQTPGIQVERLEFAVRLNDNQTHTIVGYLYTRQGNPDETEQCGKRSRTVQVLLAGATYNHRYWDVPTINGIDYSYARTMAAQCYSVLALDRLGTGESSRPSGDFISLAVEADGIAQILASLRTNQNPTQRRFKRIVLVGHSFGTLLSVYTLGEYGNVADALVATGWVHVPGTVPLTPEYVQSLLQMEHIQVAPDVRNILFYYPGSADPAVIDYDNANINDTLPRAFFLDGINVFTARALGDVALTKTLTRVDQVSVPVFVQLGDNDILFPSAIAGAEASFYSSAPSVTVDNLTNIGHGFNLHTNHAEGWQHIEAWIANNVVNN
ncbi:MAG: alpha/beta hydrolase [Chloroflexi bacterium]|nr:MAG: alpha/beta hydrolase [Chloroflexota bacterium]